ncbi:MAG: hypothetical protein HY904_01400 [Deltaproteobacteria bacterium]|nr:hypothetical protein [Deltaproteobacteria bacterium]
MTGWVPAAALALGLLGQVAPDALERRDGPSRGEALLGNGHLAVSLAADGAFTALRWPTPGHFDQLRHVTARGSAAGADPRALPRLGAARTDGMVAGVVVSDAMGTRAWTLDDAAWTRAEAVWRSDTSPVVCLRVRNDDVELLQEAWVDPARDVLLLRLEVTPLRPSTSVAAFLLAHPAPHAHRTPGWPVDDVVNDNPDAAEPNGFAAAVAPDARAVVSVAPAPWHRTRAAEILRAAAGTQTAGPTLLDGMDALGAVALALGSDRSAQIHVGASDDGAGILRPRDAWADVADGALSGNGLWGGDHTLAVLAALAPSGVSEVAFYVALGTTPSASLATLSAARAEPIQVARDRAEQEASALLPDVALPDTELAAPRAAALRALINLAALTDRDTGATVAWVDTQPFGGVARPTDGALVDLALGQAAQLGRAVDGRVRWGAWQRLFPDDSGRAGTTAGGFYTDGEDASFGLLPVDGQAWGLYADARTAGRALTTVELADPASGLRGVRLTAPRALDALLACHDSARGLPCAGDSWDRHGPVQDLWQAASVLLALSEAPGLMRALGDGDRARAAEERALQVSAGVDALLHTADPAAMRLHALALALGHAGALRDDPVLREALLDHALTRAEAALEGRGDTVALFPLVAWQLLVASRRDDDRRARAEAVLDRLVERLGPLAGAAMAHAPLITGERPRLLPRAGCPGAAASAALYLALLERHGRRPPSSLPVPDLASCACPGSNRADPDAPWGATLLAGTWLARRVTGRFTTASRKVAPRSRRG